MKGIKKIAVIGITALFIVLATTPLISGSNLIKIEKTAAQPNVIPIELSFYGPNGVVTETEELTVEDVTTLKAFFTALQNAASVEDAENIVETFLKNVGPIGALLDQFKDLAETLMLPFIISGGIGRQLSLRYHEEMNWKKLGGCWHYPTYGFTMFWANGLASVLPSRFVMGGQNGCMLGFVGFYLYIPPVYQFGTPSYTFFGGLVASALVFPRLFTF